VEVTVVNYLLDHAFTDEPFNLIGVNYGKLKLSTVRQFSKDDKVFAYLIFAQRTTFSETTRSYEGKGTIFFFAFVDRDGVANFESLITNPQSNPIVPDWITKVR